MRRLLPSLLAVAAITGCGGPKAGSSVNDVGVCLRDSGYKVTVDDQPADAGANGRLLANKGKDEGFVLFFGSDQEAGAVARRDGKAAKVGQVKRMGSIVIESKHADDISDCIDI